MLPPNRQNFRAYGRPKAGLGIRKKEKRKEKKKGRKREGEVNEYKNNSPFARHCVHSCIDCRPKALTTPHSSSEALFAEAVGRSPSMLSSARVRHFSVESLILADWLAAAFKRGFSNSHKRVVWISYLLAEVFAFLCW